MNKILGWLSLLFLVCLFCESRAQTFTNASNLLDPNQGDAVSASAIDYNNDGLVDIYQEGRLYLNRGALGFKNYLMTAGLIEGDGIFGAVFGDYDNDGYLDIFFEDFTSPGRLYRNLGNRRFRQTNDVARFSPGIFAQGSGWADFNLDGTLDLYINNDLGENLLFKNLGDGTFEDISLKAGVAQVGNSYGMAWGDFNNDGFPDIFVATCSGFPDKSINHLLRNNGDETFTNINVEAGVNDSLSSWGVIWLDYDNDALLDIFVANIAGAGYAGRPRANVLYHNQGDGTFVDVGEAAGVAGATFEIGYAAGAADFDNDGWMDIYLANGDHSPHRLFHNNGDGTFSDIAVQAGIVEDSDVAVALADFNNDGWMDIFTPGDNGSNLWFNNGGDNHWLTVFARGTTANYHGIGARMELYAGGTKQIRELNAGDSFCSQNMNLAAHFGLGTLTMIDSLIVRWPGGYIDKHSSLPVDSTITVVEGLMPNNPPKTFNLIEPADASTIENTSSPVQFRWQDAFDAEGEPLTYRLRLSGVNIDTVISGISDTAIEIEPTLFQQHIICSWTVDVQDAHSVTASMDVFSFADAQCETPHAFSIVAGALTDGPTAIRGLSLVDIDGDKNLDIYVSNGVGDNALYHNQGDLTFVRSLDAPPANDESRSGAHTWGDYNNDGHIDLFVTATGQSNQLFQNSNSGFVRIVSGAVVNDQAVSRSANWVDFDNDGFLDLSVANRSDANFLFRNAGDGTFEEITSGEFVAVSPPTVMMAWADIDNDRDADVYIVNGENNVLLINEGGNFSRVTDGELAGTTTQVEGASWGDYDNDLDLDLLLTTIGGESTLLFKNDGSGLFSQTSAGDLTQDVRGTHASGWADFDNDGDLDVVVGSGGIASLFSNDEGIFSRLDSEVLTYAGASSLVWGDYDRDGDFDILTAVAGPILYNNAGNENHWLNIRCQGTQSNRSAIGAKVRVKAVIGGQPVWQSREISSQTGLRSQSSLNGHFGLGDAVLADSIVIQWPSGLTDVSQDIQADQFVDAIEGQVITAIRKPDLTLPAVFVLGQNYPNPFNPTTQITFSLANAATVTLSIYNVAGQRIRTLLADVPRGIGRHTVQWDGSDDSGKHLASGVYVYQIEVLVPTQSGNRNMNESRKMLLLK